MSNAAYPLLRLRANMFNTTTKFDKNVDQNPCSSAAFWDGSNDVKTIQLASLGQCSLGKCSDCAQFLHFFRLVLGPEELPLDLFFERQSHVSKATSSFLWDIMPKQYSSHVEAIEVILPSARPTNEQETTPGYIGWTGAADALQLARSWLQNCINSHPGCDGYRPQPLPDRVIDVSGDCLRLYESRNENAPFISLSHCWGKTRAACTTLNKNVEAHKKGIAWDTLPQTFKDAIHVTRALGVKYIWIDNICIIQDNLEDWKRQAPQMASIYSGSYFTIAATASDSDDGGCFRNATNDLVGHAISIQRGRAGSATFNLRIRAQVQTHWLAIPSEMMTPDGAGFLGDDPPPLFTRAWCFQERMLSRRLLRFDNWDMSWSCRETETCSCGFLDQVVAPARNSDRYQHPFLLSKKERESVDSVRLWHQTLTQYGQLALTYPKDMLPAISALAQRFDATFRRDDKYMAGIWSNSLVLDMTWTRLDSDADRPKEWRAPTWSWASHNGGIMYFFHPLRAIAEVVDVFCLPVDEATAEFTSFQPGAHVVLSSSVVMGYIAGTPRSYGFSIRDGQVSSESWKREPDWAITDVPGAELEGVHVMALLLAQQARSDEHISYNGDGEYWLVLRQVKEQGDVWERVGIALIHPLPGALSVALPRRNVKII